jgi:hypothetical protein
VRPLQVASMTILEDTASGNNVAVAVALKATTVAALAGSSPAPVSRSSEAAIVTSAASMTSGGVQHLKKPPPTSPTLLNTMISNVADRYITPEYLAPLPSSVRF